jgi:hypothetical protein
LTAKGKKKKETMQVIALTSTLSIFLELLPLAPFFPISDDVTDGQASLDLGSHLPLCKKNTNIRTVTHGVLCLQIHFKYSIKKFFSIPITSGHVNIKNCSTMNV